MIYAQVFGWPIIIGPTEALFFMFGFFSGAFCILMMTRRVDPHK